MCHGHELVSSLIVLARVPSLFLYCFRFGACVSVWEQDLSFSEWNTAGNSIPDTVSALHQADRARLTAPACFGHGRPGVWPRIQQIRPASREGQASTRRRGKQKTSTDRCFIDASTPKVSFTPGMSSSPRSLIHPSVSHNSGGTVRAIWASQWTSVFLSVSKSREAEEGVEDV